MDNKVIRVNKKNLEILTDKELKILCTVEDTMDLSDDGIIGELKRFILIGKDEFTMGDRIDHIEDVVKSIIVDRWLKLI